MRKLRDISKEIEKDWKNITNFADKEALKCMKEMDFVTDEFKRDPNGYAVIGSFLSNSKGWKGKIATRNKNELRDM